MSNNAIFGEGGILELSTWDILIILVFIYFLWKWVISPRIFGREDRYNKQEPQLAPMKKQDMTLDQLKQYDGIQHDGRLLLACDGKIFDVTRGKRFYGPDGPYGVFAGRDASRGMATLTANESALRDHYDDLSDLDSADLDQMKEWAETFAQRYDVVGRLLKDDEEPTVYTDDEKTETNETENSDKKDM